jgi:hypothetical protein
MASFLDVCRFNPTAGGTTDWTYSSAVTGYQSPTAAGVVNGRLYKYRAESTDLSQWEVGEGAYNTGTGVLARTTVLYNSSGTTSKINFSAVPQVAIVALKEDLISIDESNSFTTGQQDQARSNINAARAISSVTVSLGSNVALSNIANYFDGPSVAQGTSGTWFADGTVTVTVPGGATEIYAKLWDGTTVIASTAAPIYTAGAAISISLSGYIASPAGNIRISCRDVSRTDGSMVFNRTGNSKDCTVSAIRIA